MSEVYLVTVTVKKLVKVAENSSGITPTELNAKVAEATRAEQAALEESMEAVAYSLLAYGEDRTKET